MSKTGKFNLRERLLTFSKRVIEIAKKLPRTPECDNIRKQLVAAGTSVGANYEETDGAISKKGFRYKMATARKEANESRYWLRVVSGSYLDPEEVGTDIKESTEIINIFSSIISKTQK